MPTRDAVLGQVTAGTQPGWQFSRALFASLALAGSFAAIRLNSTSILRIE